MSLDFGAKEKFELDLLKQVVEDLKEVKKKIDARGQMFEHAIDDKQLLIENLLYDILKRGEDKAAAYA